MKRKKWASKKGNRWGKAGKNSNSSKKKNHNLLINNNDLSVLARSLVSLILFL